MAVSVRYTGAQSLSGESGPASAQGGAFSVHHDSHINNSNSNSKSNANHDSSSARHAVEHIQSTTEISSQQRRDALTSALFGSHMPQRLRMEEEILGHHGTARLPGLPSSFVGLDTSTGTSKSITFQDYLSPPSESPEQPALSLHEVQQIRLGMM